jgi:hypothetical protein
MQFTRNSQMVLLLELPFCREALGKNLSFTMWPLGGRPARVSKIPVRLAGVWPGKGWGGVYGPLGSYLGTGSVGRGGR